MFEAQAMWQHRVERKYSTDLSGAVRQSIRLPMLANKYVQGRVDFPAWVQPKFNGVRCVARLLGDRVELISRAGKPYKVAHIEDALAQIDRPSGTVLDGEIYLHGAPLQEITSLVKRTQEGSVKLTYNVYDMPSVEAPWVERRIALDELAYDLTECTDVIKITNSKLARTHDDLVSLHNKYVKQGYEGAMVRLSKGMYEWGYRSSALLKFKVFQDDEFAVVGFEEGRGRMEGAVIWICETETGQQFNCSMRCTMEERRKYFKNGDKYIGRLLTVRYFELTNDGIPQFPVGIAFRDAKDL